MRRILLKTIAFCLVLAGGAEAQNIGRNMGVGFSLSGQKLYGDTYWGSFEYGVTPVLVRFNFNNTLFLDSDIGYARLRTSAVETNVFNFGVRGGYRLFLKNDFSPYVYLGTGVLAFKLQRKHLFFDGYGSLGGGLEYFVHPAIGLNLSGDFRYTTGDDFDGGKVANGKDGYFSVALGANYYFSSGQPKSHSPSLYSAEMQEVPASNQEQNTSNGMGQTTMSAGPPSAAPSMKLQVEKERLLTKISERDEELQLLEAKRNIFVRQIKTLRNAMQSANGRQRSGQMKDSILPQFNQGLLLYAGGEFDDAIEIFSTLLTDHDKHPDTGKWWYWLGESYFARDDYISAISAFENALLKGVSATKYETAELMLAMSRWRAGYLERAYTDFRQLLKDEPDQVYETLIHEYLAQIELSIPQ